MRTPLNLSLEIEIVNGLKKYSADHGVSLTSVLQEIICQFLGLKGLLDPELKAAVEERIERRAGRPVDQAKKAEREKRAAEEQAKVYREAGVKGPGPPEDEPAPHERLDRDASPGLLPPSIDESKDEDREDRNRDKAFEQDNFDEIPDDRPPGPPIFKLDEHPVDKTYVGPSPLKSTTERIENIVSKPRPICLRCMEVVAKCECAEGPDEG